MAILTDEEITELLQERKRLPAELPWPPKLRPSRGHERAQVDIISGTAGSEFQLSIRRADRNLLDFSVILGYRLPGSYRIFRLRRYNGKSHWHSNPIEGGEPFFDFHTHTATARYQDLGAKEEHFAEITRGYYDLEGAIEMMLRECGFEQRTIEGPLFPMGTDGSD